MQSLRTYRLKQGFTQRELAERAGVGQATIVRIEKTGMVHVKTMHKLAQALGVEPEEISEFHHQIYGGSSPITPEGSSSPTPS